MVPVPHSCSQKAAAEKQEGAALLGVVTHQGHEATNKREQCGDALQQRVRLPIALPGHLAENETSKQQYDKDHDVADGSSSSLVSPPILQFDHIPAVHR